jgi:hypothetical protein
MTIHLVLLQYHAQIEMRDAIQKAFADNIRRMMNSGIEPVNPLLVLHVNRKSIVQDTINQVLNSLSIEFRYKINIDLCF